MGNSLKKHLDTARVTGTLQLRDQDLSKIPPEVLAPDISSRLRTIDLGNNKLSLVPPEITCFKNLKSLMLDNNSLVRIPAEVGQLSRLEILKASHNQLGAEPPATKGISCSSPPPPAIPPSLSALCCLRQLELSHNALTEFPSAVFTLERLELIDLSENHIAVLPEGVRQMCALIELNLNRNQLNAISPAVCDCERLAVLRVQENCLELRAIAESKLLKHSRISAFYFEGNLFDAKQLTEVDGWHDYEGRYSAAKKKLL